MLDLSKLKEKLKDTFRSEYRDAASDAKGAEMGLRGMVTASALAGVAFIGAASLLALAAAPVAASLFALGAKFAAGAIALKIAAVYPLNSYNNRQAEKKLEQDAENGALLTRYQTEVLPKKAAELKALAAAQVNERKAVAKELVEESKLSNKDFLHGLLATKMTETFAKHAKQKAKAEAAKGMQAQVLRAKM